MRANLRWTPLQTLFVTQVLAIWFDLNEVWSHARTWSDHFCFWIASRGWNYIHIRLKIFFCFPSKTERGNTDIPHSSTVMLSDFCLAVTAEELVPTLWTSLWQNQSVVLHIFFVLESFYSTLGKISILLCNLVITTTRNSTDNIIKIYCLTASSTLSLYGPLSAALRLSLEFVVKIVGSDPRMRMPFNIVVLITLA